MISRDDLWRRLGGEGYWALAWALAAASAVPWLVPEDWSGHLSGTARAAGWAVLALALPPALRRHRLGLAVAMALALAWGTLGALARLARWEATLPAGMVRVQGRLASPWVLRGRSRTASLRVSAPAALRGALVPLSLPAGGAPPPAPGTPVVVRGELVPRPPAPAFLAERPLWRARDAGTPRTLRLASALLFEPLGPARPGPALALRDRVQQRFRALPLAGPARDLWGALALGIPPAQGEAFSSFAQSGTIHTLVVSGLQVTLVMGGLEALCRRLLGRGSPWAAAAGGLAYGAVVGLTAPVWRGLIMGLAWAAGRGTGWRLPPALTLHLALVAWLMGHPAAGCDPGFLLSWLALVGVFWVHQPLAGLLGPVWPRLAGPLARLLGPWLTTLPLLALFHGGAPLWGVPANLLLLPLVTVLTPACLVLTCLPLPGLVGALGRALAWVGGTPVPAFAKVVPLATGQAWPWLVLILGWLLLAQRHARFARTRALAAALALATLGLLAARGTGRGPRSFSVEAIDIGQGDALLIRVPGGPATLVDAGPDARAARRIARVLSRRGVREPVHLILTHPHLDHAGGWAALDRLWPLVSVARPAMAAAKWGPFLPAGARASPLRRGDAWTRGGAAYAVRWPPGPMALADVNMNSAVLRVRWRDREVWLMGDALATQERDLLDLGDPGPPHPGRLVKAGHHGSRSATTPAWADALAPRLALICAGRGNRFDHPHPEALAALAAAEVLVTGDCLGARAEAWPGGWLVETGRGRRMFLADWP